MRCEKYKPTLNEFFNKTLSPGEERELEGHLAACRDCRSDFQKLKRADDLLRVAVREMVLEIEVPADLDQKIKSVLDGNRPKNPFLYNLPSFFRTPAVAAAMLFLVLGVSLFGLYDLFGQSARQQVVMTETPAAGTGSREKALITAQDAAPDGEMRSELPEAETDSARIALDVMAAQPEASVSERRSDPPPSQSARSRESYPAQGNPAPEDRGEGGAGSETAPSAATLLAPPGRGGSPADQAHKEVFSIAGGPTDRKGTLAEAAAETGIRPARPHYLPPGAQLSEVTWLPGQISQYYRMENASFAITQGLAELSGEKQRQRPGQETIIINGAEAVLEVTGAADGSQPPYAALSWQRGQYSYTIEGGVSREDIIKIAASLD